MNDGVDPSPLSLAKRKTSQDGIALFWAALRKSPLRKGVGLLIEYAMFAAGVFLALALLLARVPLRFIDRALGLRLRERFIDFVARLSPG
jgi:hypothetical protein